MHVAHGRFVGCGIPTVEVQDNIRLIALALGFPSMITLFLAGLASVAVGPLLALFVADRTTTDVTSTVPVSAGMFVAPSNDNAVIATQRTA